MEKEIKNFKSIRDKFYADAEECLGNVKEDGAVVLLEQQGDNCVSSMIGLGGNIADTITEPMLNDERIAALFQIAVKQYKVAKHLKNLNPNIVKGVIEEMKELQKEMDKKKKEQEEK